MDTPKEGKEQKVVLSVRINPGVLKRLDELAERTGVGRAEIVDRCVRAGLREEEELADDLQRPIVGELIHALTNEKVVKMLGKLMHGEKFEVDPIQMKRREFLKNKRRGGRATGETPAME
jgi:metal-responsive CopG/Arc/MetJ family transcriptional regulator